MTVFKKVRGQRKKWKDIADWVEHYKTIDIQYFESSQRDYAKVWVHPWSSISMINSQIQEPKGKTRRLITEGLLSIYASWKEQLEQRNQPYYLKIWLYEPNLSESQVVCATGNMLNFYDKTFSKTKGTKQLNSGNFGHLKTQIELLNWELHKEEFHFSEEDIGEPEEYASMADYRVNKKHLTRLMKHPNISIHTYEQDEEQRTLYAHQIGNVWIGGS